MTQRLIKEKAANLRTWDRFYILDENFFCELGLVPEFMDTCHMYYLGTLGPVPGELKDCTAVLAVGPEWKEDPENRVRFCCFSLPRYQAVARVCEVEHMQDIEELWLALQGLITDESTLNPLMDTLTDLIYTSLTGKGGEAGDWASPIGVNDLREALIDYSKKVEDFEVLEMPEDPGPQIHYEISIHTEGADRLTAEHIESLLSKFELFSLHEPSLADEMAEILDDESFWEDAHPIDEDDEDLEGDF